MIHRSKSAKCSVFQILSLQNEWVARSLKWPGVEVSLNKNNFRKMEDRYGCGEELGGPTCVVDGVVKPSSSQ